MSLAHLLVADPEVVRSYLGGDAVAIARSGRSEVAR